MTLQEKAQLTYDMLQKRKKERKRKMESEFIGFTVENHWRIQKRCRRYYK